MSYPQIPFAATSSLPSWARTAGRALRLNIRPRPAHIAESKNVLHVLQKYGRVLSFHSLKYEPDAKAPNVALALFEEQASADKLLQERALVLEMGSWGVRQVRPDQPLNEQTSTPTDPRKPPSPAAKGFYITVHRSDMDFYARAQRQPYYSSFNLDRTSIMYHDLQAKVPVKAMADCQLSKGEIPRRIRAHKLEMEETQRRGQFRESVLARWRESQAKSEEAEPA